MLTEILYVVVLIILEFGLSGLCFGAGYLIGRFELRKNANKQENADD